MKLFKTVDEKLAELGFVKILEDQYGARYERENAELGYIHCLNILHRNDGKHRLQSFEKGINSDGLHNMVSLTYKEAKLALQKMRQLGFDLETKLTN